MKSSVCTLFEGDFHKGVAVLINSLYKYGFKGEFYAGYRGSLPKWTIDAELNSDLNWPGAKTMKLAGDLSIHFLPIGSNYHLTHCKPSFMLNLLEGPARDADYLAYFDPDIVNLCKWSFYEKWMDCGVAMVHEVVSNDMPATHPGRTEWNKVIKLLNKEPKRQLHSYINAGFCGIARENIEFLKVWIQVIEIAITHYDMDPSTFINYDRTSAFYAIDQDAFNIAAMCCDSPISEMGPEAMDFENSGWTMSHATGWPKPWNNKFIISALGGHPPNRPHKHYWRNIDGQITLYSNMHSSLIKADIFIATLIGRFYRR
jgi:hypothetical protein